MKEKNLGFNTILNVIKSGLSVLFPLITYPYVLRILGEEGVGRISYCASIISYFSMIAMLGIATYGIREGAKRKTDKKEFRQFVNEVYTINICSTIIAYVLLFCIVCFLPKLHSYSKLLALQSLSIILTTMGLDWVNTIFEDFFLITVRSIFTHLLSFALLFLLVRTPDDYYWYALLTVITNGIVCVSNWFYVRKYVKPQITFHLKLQQHIGPLLLLFSNSIAISIYVNFDTTMLGWMKGDYYVGLYAVAVKIYTIMKSLLAAIYVVTIPRLAFYIGKKKQQEYKKVYTDLWGYLSILLIPSGIGLLCISHEIMILMGGAKYGIATPTLQILSIGLIFAVFGGLITAVLNITIGKEQNNLIATILSAVINCGLNLILIPLFNQNGAAFTTLLSEFFVFGYCFAKIENKSNYLDFSIVLKAVRDALVGSALILLFSFFVKQFIDILFLRMMVIIGGSVILYALSLSVLKNIYFLYVFTIAKKRWDQLLEKIGGKLE
ncbi:MAG: flippase [Lachnospiraceae bacterium]|jgi:O-antigen/teichoic acid export membrane protein|nr:flippase [Lachnospiraceae bacterium]